MSEQDRSREALVSLLAGIGLGVLIGAATALLLAPQSGAETRSYIGDTATETLGKVRDSIDDMRVKLDETIAHTKQAMSRQQPQPPAPSTAEPGPEGGPTVATPPSTA